MSEATKTHSVLTPEIKAMIGVEAERIECSLPWGVEREGLRVFCNAIMDPDPRYWDEEFAKTTRYGGLVTPPAYATYVMRRTLAGAPDPVTAAFQANENSDGIGGVAGAESRGGLPVVKSDLKRILNAGNEIEVLQYPKIGDRIFSQARYSSIVENTARDGSKMLIITVETRYTNQDGDLLCMLRAAQMRR